VPKTNGEDTNPLRNWEGRSARWFPVFVALILFFGCGRGGLERIAIQGNVTFEGQPLMEGDIVFAPRQQGLPMSVGEISSGKFSIPKDKGPSPGSYDVKISGYRKTGRKVAPSPYTEQRQEAEEIEQFLPAKFNEATELHAEFIAGQSTIDFALE
jgi:hypothetical protein